MYSIKEIELNGFVLQLSPSPFKTDVHYVYRHSIQYYILFSVNSVLCLYFLTFMIVSKQKFVL